MNIPKPIGALLAGLCLLACSPDAGSQNTAATLPKNSAAASQTTTEKAHSMKINVIANGHTLPATLANGSAARDFYRQLPMEFELTDYAGNEKITPALPNKLDISGEPGGVAGAVGDINYYAPWGNIGIFYRPFRHSEGLVHLGRFDGDFSAILHPENTTVRFEKAE